MKGRLLGYGREAEIFEWEPGTVLRLLRDPGAGALADQQLATLRVAHEGGRPVPRPYARVDVDGRPGVVMERIDGMDMLTMLGRRPWNVLSLARVLGEVHASLAGVVMPAAVASVRDHLAVGIERAEPLSRQDRHRASALLADLPDGDRLIHGDFHPGNVLLGPRGPVVIDWALAVRGHPTADFARSRLLVGLGEVPPGASAILRAGDRLGRRAFARTYERTYRRHQPVDEASLPAWMIVQAAARFSEGIEGEFPALRRVLSGASG